MRNDNKDWNSRKEERKRYLEQDSYIAPPVYYEEQPGVWAQKRGRFIRISVLLQAVVGTLFLAALFLIKESFFKGLAFSGFLLLLGIGMIINLIEQEKLRSRLFSKGIRMEAVLTEFSGREGKQVTPYFDFEDANGLHHLPGYEKMKVKRRTEEEYLGQRYQVIYDAECPSAVLYEGMKSRGIGRMAGTVIGLAVILLAMVFTLLYSFLILRSPEVKEGDYMRIKWNNSYEASKYLQEDVESDTVQWLCNTYAIYTQYNRKEIGRIGGVAKDDDTMGLAIGMALNDGWGISDRDSAIRCINNLLNNGHRQKYREIIKSMEKSGYLELSEAMLLHHVSDTEQQYSYLAAYRAYQAFGEHGIDAWDYCRATQILGDCYQLGYISLEECLDQSLVIGKTLQETYESWEDLAMSYLYGCQFWQNDDMESSISDSGGRREAYETLKKQIDGPYELPFDTELKNTWSNPEQPEKEDAEGAEEAGEEYYDVFDNSNKGKVKIKAPEGFVWSDLSDKHGVNFEKENEDRFFNTSCFYILSDTPLSDKSEYEASKLKRQKSLCEIYTENGDTVEMVELQSFQVGELEVFCTGVLSTQSDGDKKRELDIWTWLDEERLLINDMSEYMTADDTPMPLEELVTILFGNDVLKY